MSGRSPRLEWLPPLLVGASAAVVAEVAMSMLLYGGTGLVRSLTTVLAAEGLAFAGGLWGGPAVGPDIVDRLRRRWLLCLFAFVGAVIFGTAWSVFAQLSEGRLGQGAGLALLAGLPLYSAGAVLGGMSVLAASDPGERLAAPGAAAAAGAALGFVLTGLLLPRVPVPASLLVACLVMLSLGGMVYGGVLAARTEIRVLGRRPGRGLEVCVEERHVPADDVAARELREGAFLRRSVPLGHDPITPWDVSVALALMPRATSHADDASPLDGDSGGETGSRWRLLLVGGGSSSAARTVLEALPNGSVDVLERTPAIVELAREHFGTGLTIGRGDRCNVTVGNLDDAISACDGSYDLVIVDSAALAPIGGITSLSRMARRRLPALVRTNGSLVWGPDGSELDLADVSDGWRWRLYRRPAESDASTFESVLLVGRDDGERWTPAVGGFKEVGAS